MICSQVLQDRLHGFCRLGRAGGNLVADLSGSGGWEDRVALHLLKIIGYPIYQFVATAAKGLDIHDWLLFWKMREVGWRKKMEGTRVADRYFRGVRNLRKGELTAL
jgi:hypothetical protein